MSELDLTEDIIDKYQKLEDKLRALEKSNAASSADEERFQSLRREKNAIQSRFDETLQKIAALEEAVKSARRENDELRLKVSGLDDAQEKIRSLTLKLTRLESTSRPLAPPLPIDSGELERQVKQRVASLENELNKARAEIKKQKTEILLLRDQNDALSER